MRAAELFKGGDEMEDASSTRSHSKDLREDVGYQFQSGGYIGAKDARREAVDVGCMRSNFAKPGGMDIVAKGPLMHEDYRRRNIRVHDKDSISSVLQEPLSKMLLTKLFSPKLRYSAKYKWNVIETGKGKILKKKGRVVWNRRGLRQRSVLRELFAGREKLPPDLAHAGLHNNFRIVFPRIKDKALVNGVRAKGGDWGILYSQ